jgi:hypothetical protein
MFVFQWVGGYPGAVTSLARGLVYHPKLAITPSGTRFETSPQTK